MSKKVKVNMSISPPLVYLDTCAYDLFFKQEFKGEKEAFLKAINSKGATLAVSWTNVVELGGRLRDDQIEAIYFALNTIVTKVIEVIPSKVIDKEKELIAQKGRLSDKYVPLACGETIKWLGEINNWPRRGGIYCYPTAADFLMAYHDERKQNPEKGTYFDELYKKLEFVRKNMTNEKEIRSKIKNKLRAKIKLREKNKFPYFTDEIFSLAVNFVISNRTSLFNRDSHWFDVCHVVVPISYCDLIVVDKRWSHFTTQILKNCGLQYPYIGRAFSFKKSGISCLINEMKNPHSLIRV